MRLAAVCLLALVLLAACAAPAPAVTPQIITIHYTFATRPWLADLYACAGKLPQLVVQADERSASFLDPASADLVLRLGAPPRLDTPAYALGEEEIVVVVHPSNPLESLTLDQAADLFSGRARDWQQVGGPQAPVQVWAFHEGEDIQQAFEDVVLNGGPITPSARLAQSAAEMAAAVASDPAALGFVPKRLMSSSVRPIRLEGQSGLILPALLIVRDEPQGSLRELVACLQD